MSRKSKFMELLSRLEFGSHRIALREPMMAIDVSSKSTSAITVHTARRNRVAVQLGIDAYVEDNVHAQQVAASNTRNAIAALVYAAQREILWEELYPAFAELKRGLRLSSLDEHNYVLEMERAIQRLDVSMRPR